MIAVVKYNAGNIRSAGNALQRLGYDYVITGEKEDIIKADKVIIPGVGEAGSAMKHLRQTGLDKVLLSLKQPVLGICLGLQLMCRHSEESDTECLGIFDSDVRLFPHRGIVPHMGWNNFSFVNGELFRGLLITDNVYYVHSYYADLSPCTIAICNYILPFSAAMRKDNFFGVQFHPEKSSSAGERILKNFLEL